MKKFVLPLALVISWVLYAPSPVLTDELTAYVRQYQTTGIPQEALRKIERFDSLINYFTSFHYIQTNYRVSSDFVKALILAESDAVHEI